MPESPRDDPLLRDIPEHEGYKVLPPAVLFVKIGRGGMGDVYRGRHMTLGVDVAVKCLKPSLALEDQRFVERFDLEARLAAEINHENLVRVYHVDEHKGVHYLVMEFVEGETARDRVKRKGPLSEAEAAKIMLGASRGLGKAHRHRRVVVHRDVKPENILISREGEVKIADLGIAKALGAEGGLTASGMAMGTPQYMAPEQWDDARKVGPSSDVWSLGATLFFLIAGENAIEAGTIQKICRDICDRPFPDLRAKRPGVSDDIIRILARCTAHDPTERYRDAGELAAELEAFVAKNDSSLADSGSGKVKSASLVSPPPVQSIRRIRAKIAGTGTGFEPTPTPASLTLPTPAGGLEISRTMPAGATDAEHTMPAKPERKNQSRLYWKVGLALLVVAGAVVWIATRPASAPLSASTVIAAAPSARAPDGWEIVDTTMGTGGWARKVREPRSQITFLLVEPGTFQMGSSSSEDSRMPDELQHTVELTTPYYLGETEVTQAQYESVKGANPSEFKGAKLPVEGVSWDDARSYCEAVGGDLPTEAQWEYACRAMKSGISLPFSFGATLSTDEANFDGRYAYGSGKKGKYRQQTVEAGSLPSNAWGFHEMHGNVWEWCLDAYRSDYKNLAPKDPVQSTGDSRVLRGGSWFNGGKFCRSAYRGGNAGAGKLNILGFRVAKTLN